MKCWDSEKLIQKKLDGEISEEELRLLGEHLHRCRRCAQALADYEWIARTRAADALSEGARPVGVLSRDVMARLRDQSPVEEKRPRWRFAPAFAAVAASLVLVLGLAVLGRMGRAGDRPGVPPPKDDQPASEIAEWLPDLSAIETPDILKQSDLFLTQNIETLKADAETTRDALAKAFGELTRDFPLI